ncbi:Protein of unknown function [Evansella caseinilytica]|uniref:Damage-inducible protein DinB n=1 Tax=Evansella caseinilytica TaxID=1503961 RepID=A0A1H3V204_9BACI|nr:DUF1572 family protein [Evansella caseinilytica]SDZ68251.1 Protein of unknown function [Evansella caseinilytica]
MSIGKEYLNTVLERFSKIKSLGEKTMSQLSDEDIHWKYNEESNSVAVIVKHVSGNMISKWTDFLTSDGEKPTRNRDQEFTDDIATTSELLQVWEKGWKTLFATLSGLKEQDLLKNVSIRGEKHLVIEAIDRELFHSSYHTGQIVYVGKQIKNADWESLSIPKGQSEQHNREMFEKNKAKNN